MVESGTNITEKTNFNLYGSYGGGGVFKGRG